MSKRWDAFTIRVENSRQDSRGQTYGLNVKDFVALIENSLAFQRMLRGKNVILTIKGKRYKVVNNERAHLPPQPSWWERWMGWLLDKQHKP